MTKWWQNSVIYQIYPSSFQDSNHDGLGDIKGITSRLDYLKELGIDIIWLSPIYKSPQVDNGYDISDYRAINPDYGTMEDFDELQEKAHNLGIKIMMDLVVNHTSDQHNWFKEAQTSRNSKYRDYYIWRDGKNGSEPNNWESFFTGSAWKYDEQTNQYYLHLFAPEQPDLNWENPDVRHSVYDMMNWWVARGVDGFRMDVINYISKTANLPDGQKFPHEKYANPEPLVANGPRIHEFLQEMNQNVLAGKDLVTVGETPAVTTNEALKYANLEGTELGMVFQFEHMGLDADPIMGRWTDKKAKLSDLRDNFTKWQSKLAGKAWNSLYWNNHDQPRVVSRFGDDSTEENRILSAKMLATMLHFQQGTPFIYQGEEIGMTNAYFDNIDDYVDLDSLNAYHKIVDEQKELDGPTMLKYLGLHSRDNARTPMQWDDSDYAGFSSVDTWEKVNNNYHNINVKKALADQNSIFYYYQKLISLRHNLPVITNGDYQVVAGNENDENIFAYTRHDGQTTLMVLLNYCDKDIAHQYTIPNNAKILISNYEDEVQGTLRPYEAKVYMYQN